MTPSPEGRRDVATNTWETVGVTVPDYQSLMLPVLQAVREGQPYRVADIRSAVAAALGLTDEDLTERIRSGSPVFDSRVHWAIT